MDIVVYKSKTGFTKQYANWISVALECEAMSLEEFRKRRGTFDRIIFGGWVFGGLITGLKDIRSMGVEPYAVFAVGVTPAYDEVISQLKTDNKLEKLFYFEGGMRFNAHALPLRLMLKMLGKSVSRKDNPTRQELYMAKQLGTSFDHSSESSIAPLLSFIRES